MSTEMKATGKFDGCDHHDRRDRNCSISAIVAIAVATIAEVADQDVSIRSLGSLRLLNTFFGDRSDHMKTRHYFTVEIQTIIS